MIHQNDCKDSLVEIYSESKGYGTYAVVRWCTMCGAVVVDSDVDGRTNPGAIMGMCFPRGVK